MNDASRMPVPSSPEVASPSTATRTRSFAIYGGLGAGGGFVGALIAEIVQRDGETSRFASSNLLVSTGIWFSLALLGMGIALSFPQGVLERNLSKAARSAALVAPASLIGGFIAGVIAQRVYEELFNVGSNVIPRSIGWAIAGALGGAAIGAPLRSLVRLRNCTLGGLVGGFLGGLFFNTVTEAAQNDVAARFIGLTLIGAFMGLAIALINDLTVTSGIEMLRAEGPPVYFPLYEVTTILGCANNVGITVMRDPGIAEQHVRLVRSGNELRVDSVDARRPFSKDGMMVTAAVLRPGETFGVGSTIFRYVARGAAKALGGYAVTSAATPPASPMPPVQPAARPTVGVRTPTPTPASTTTPPRPEAPTQPGRAQIPMKPK